MLSPDSVARLEIAPLFLNSKTKGNDMKAKTILIAVMGVFFVLSVGIAAQNMGAESLVIKGGKSGDVSFPHKLHQDNRKDCNICHDVFPQEAGSIDKLKADGTLKKKQVMNKQCVNCHTEQKKAGNPTGPTTCSKCHVK